MKKIKILFLGFFLIGFICGCEDLLDKFPQDRLSPTTYFSTEEELKLYSNKFYYDIFPSASSVYGESADAIIITPLNENVSGQRTIPSSGGGWTFSALRRINFMLEGLSNCEDLTIRNQYEGLARFFRAYFYFEKVKRFGDVPWYNKVLGSDDPDLYKPRDSRELVMDSIMVDLNYAINYLPQKKETYRVTRWTALALKSRACLFEGTFRKYHGMEGYEKYLDACIEASEIFMDESGYSLYKTGTAPYQDLFSSLNAISQEIILARNYNSTVSLVHSVQNYENSTTMGRPGLSKKIVNYYLMDTGQRFTEQPGFETMEFYEECQNRDPRLKQTIRTPEYVRPGETRTTPPNLSFTLTGYHPIKYGSDPIYDAYNKSENDIPLFRTAEIYLNYAEAKAEKGTLTQEDINKSIKLLRDRAGMPNLSIDDANTNPDPYLADPVTGYRGVSGTNKGVILEIRRERLIELIMEGFRYYDMMRWKCGKSFEQDFLGIYIPGPGVYDFDRDGVNDVCLYSGSRPNVSATLFLEIGTDIYLSEGTKGNIICHQNIVRTWNENRDYLYPIPTEDRSLTGGVLTQNPGWDDGLEF